MKHHIESEVLIGMDNGDVENNGCEERVLETDNVRISQRTWSETNVLTWACVHDDAMQDGGKLQAVLRGTRPHVAVVEHGPRRDSKEKKTSSALIDVGSKARFDKSVRSWARKEGYGCAYIVGEATEAMTVLSVLRPLRVCLGFSISGANAHENNLIAEGSVVLLEYEDWTLVSAVVPKRKIGMGWREYVDVWSTFWRLLEAQVTEFASPSKTVVYAGNLGVALQKCEVHNGLDRVSNVGSVTLATTVKNFCKRMGLVVASHKQSTSPAENYTYFPSAQDKRRGRGARTTHVMTTERMQTTFPKLQEVVNVSYMGGGAHVPVMLTLATCPTLIRRHTVDRLRTLCREGVR